MKDVFLTTTWYNLKVEVINFIGFATYYYETDWVW